LCIVCRDIVDLGQIFFLGHRVSIAVRNLDAVYLPGSLDN
jgi:hypothetical protein